MNSDYFRLEANCALKITLRPNEFKIEKENLMHCPNRELEG